MNDGGERPSESSDGSGNAPEFIAEKLEFGGMAFE
jgi:hypothetical protein